MRLYSQFGQESMSGTSLIAVDDFDILAAVEGAVGGFGSGEGLFDFDVEDEDEA